MIKCLLCERREQAQILLPGQPRFLINLSREKSLSSITFSSPDEAELAGTRCALSAGDQAAQLSILQIILILDLSEGNIVSML